MSEARKDLLERLENELDRQINVVVMRFQNLGEQELSRQGANGGWSIAQNLEHLNMYFDYYLPAVAKALSNAKEDQNADQFYSGWLGSYFSKSMDYRNKKKIKAFSDYIPKENLDTGKVIRTFIQNEEELLHLVRKAKSYNLTKIRIAISLTKWITMRLGDVFQFIILHNERHLRQADFRISNDEERMTN